MFKNKSFLAEQAIQTSLRLTQGIDTYVKKGANITQLAMQADARSRYLEPCQPLVSLLLREDTNPLIEEGEYIAPSNRMHQGELYLTHDAITLLIEKKIRHHKPSKKGLPYHSRNTYVIKNDAGNLAYILSGLQLSLDDDAKIIYLSGIHAIPIYLRNQQGRIRCFIVDSEAGLYGLIDPIIDVFYYVFPQLELVMSTTTLQRDYYSCSTFAIKALLYFVKHGADVFPWLDAAKTVQKNYGQQSYKALEPNHLMPALLKMGQHRLALLPEALATVVSTKQKLTLNDYFQRYTLNFGVDEEPLSGQFSKHSVNSAALVKKYRYFIVLNDYLQKITSQTISSSAYDALPNSIQKRIDGYAILHEVAPKKIAINPIDIYLDIVSFLDTATPLPNPESQSLLNQIGLKFPDYQGLYLSSINDTWVKDRDILLVKKLFFIAALSEINHFRYFSDYDDFLLKLSQLFPTYPMIIAYLKKHAIAHSKQPVHDLCLFMMPESKNWNKNYWASLVMEHGMAATRYLALASQIDTLLIEHADARHRHSFTELAWIKHLLEHFSYKQADKNKKLAALCVRFKRSESQFEDSLALVSQRAKSFDFLPEITLCGRDIDERLARFTFAKLAVDDLRGLFLGEYTSCCQSLHKAGEDCAIHGMTSAFSGFYVVYDGKKIIAQSWVWIGSGGEIVFDSWEYINKNQAYLCKPFILKAAEQFVNAGFTKVLLGKGGNTPDLPFISAKKPVPFPLPNRYSDAHSQYLIKSSPYQTKLARFKAFTEYLNGIDLYANYYQLFEESLDTNAIATQLSQLIATHKLSFDHFFKLVHFLYICQHEVLHQHQELLRLAIKTYGCLMLPLFLLNSITNKAVAAAIIALDDTNILSSIIMSLMVNNGQPAVIAVQKPLIHSLLFCAATSDMIQNFSYLAALFEAWGAYDDLAALINHDKQSLLFYCAAHNAFQCLEFILARMQNKVILTGLLSYENKDGTIIHLLAKANQLACFQSIERLCPGNAVIPKLLDNTTRYRFSGPEDRPYFINADVKSVAFMSGSYDFLRYLLDYWLGGATKKQKIDHLLHMISPSTLEAVLRMGDIKALTFLQSMHDNEKHWLSSLVSLPSNPLQTALLARQFDCALFLIDSLLHIDHLHQLLTYCGSDSYLKYLPLDHVPDDIAPNERDRLLRKILTIYAPYRHKANALFCTRSHAILSGLIKSKNDALFKEVLVYLAQDTKLFEAVLFIDKYTFSTLGCEDNLLDSLLKVKLPEGDEPLIKTFIDILFDVTSLEQQKKMLLTLRSLCTMPSNVSLNYLLQKVENMGDESFRRQWANFKNKGPLKRAVVNPNSAIMITMMDYYMTLYTFEQMQAFVSDYWKFMLSRFVDDVMLLKYIYLMLKNDSGQLKELFLASSSIQIKKIILINHSAVDRNDLLAGLKAQSVNDMNKRMQITRIKMVEDYIELLAKIDILRNLKRSLSQQPRSLSPGLSFFQQPDPLNEVLATVDDPLFYVNESNQLVFTDAKPIHDCWQAVKDHLRHRLVRQASEELSIMYQQYYNQMIKAESPSDESLTKGLVM